MKPTKTEGGQKGDEPPLPGSLSSWKLWLAGHWGGIGFSTMGFLAGLAIFAGDLQQGSLSLGSFAYLIGGVVFGIAGLAVARRYAMVWMLAKISAERPDEAIKDHTYVLYLRPFEEDRRLFTTDSVLGRGMGPVLGQLVGLTGGSVEAENVWESRVIQFFRRLGHVVGVADPDSKLLYPGAFRFRLPKGDWKPVVSDAIRQARLVILVAGIGRDGKVADGTLWEYSEVVRLLPPSRVLLLVCGEQEAYDRFRQAAQAKFAERRAEETTRLPTAPELPDYPPLHHPRRRGRPHPLRGVVRFGPRWQAEFIRFDPTIQRGLTPSQRWRATERDQIEPLLAEIEQKLPGTALVPEESWRSRWMLVGIVHFVVMPYALMMTASDMLAVQKAVCIAIPVIHALGGLRYLTLSERNLRYHRVTVRLPRSWSKGRTPARSKNGTAAAAWQQFVQ
ncbi:hypothetical protein AB0I84_39735 [Streptomyces spectabilis]|uniref:hypothetical protein n=1 Tax=Streptomyces spectabilis TaxID=68270 RepID=UPI0033E7DD4D